MIHAGAAVAALTCATSCSDTTEAGDLPTTNDSTTTPTALEAYSLDQVGCFGPTHDGGYYGQCCFKASCYTPTAGESCASTEAILANANAPIGQRKGPGIGLPPGSGSCGCSLPDEDRPALAGPFASNPAHTPEQAGSCCYVLGAISCTGRPLVVDGTQLIASVIERSDWLA